MEIISTELLADQAKVTLLKGGKGNMNFKSSVNQAPLKIVLGNMANLEHLNLY